MHADWMVAKIVLQMIIFDVILQKYDSTMIICKNSQIQDCRLKDQCLESTHAIF